MTRLAMLFACVLLVGCASTPPPQPTTAQPASPEASTSPHLFRRVVQCPDTTWLLVDGYDMDMEIATVERLTVGRYTGADTQPFLIAIWGAGETGAFEGAVHVIHGRFVPVDVPPWAFAQQRFPVFACQLLGTTL